CTTIPETPDAPRSDCHAWGAIAIYEFAAVVLGVRTVSAAEKKLRIAPRIDGRDHAHGTVYTGCGPVKVAWTYSDGLFTLRVRSASGAEKEIVLPDGQTVVTRYADVSLAARL
ncbi:MAG: hypothetical protein II557_12765, partial [Clostridia bacterium]|nr:hypothetical protein [Clostridia bacterium]